MTEVVFCVGHFERSPVGEFSYTTLATAHTMERKMTGAKIKSAYRYLNAQGAPTGLPPDALLAQAVGGGLEYEVPATGRGANLEREHRATDLFGVGGKGGVLLGVSQNLEAAVG